MADQRVLTWLQSVGLESYYNNFIERRITAEQFIGFTMQDYGLSLFHLLYFFIVIIYFFLFVLILLHIYHSLFYQRMRFLSIIIIIIIL